MTSDVLAALAEAQQQVAALRDALVRYADLWGGAHGPRCPGDSTCNCEYKAVNDAVNAILANTATGSTAWLAAHDFALLAKHGLPLAWPFGAGPMPPAEREDMNSWLAAHDADVRRAALEEAAREAETFFDRSDEPADISASMCGEMIGGAIRRALAAQPEGK
jgi:hypothetical protein